MSVLPYPITFLGGALPVQELAITANTQNVNLFNFVQQQTGWGGTSPIIATITVASGIVVGSNSTSSYALDTGVFPVGSTLTLVNNGFIVGQGGNGGGPFQNGFTGGPALRAQTPIEIKNNGTVGGGGGGGASGGGGGDLANWSGGGGGAGNSGGQGGGSRGVYTSNGGSGSLTTGGDGGGWGGPGYRGGRGGDLGQNGYSSCDGCEPPNGRGFVASGVNGNRTGGAAGAAVVGNSFITWAPTGTRLGSIS